MSEGLSNLDFIATLRDTAEVEGAGTMGWLLNEAADRIEALDERVAIMSVEREAEKEAVND